MKVLLVSLGCDKNLVDSEMMLGMLADAGYQITDDESEADIIIVNSCCFIMDAKQESIDTLIEMGTLKERGRCKALIAAGCLAQRYAKEIHEEIPEVDAVIGTTGIGQLIAVIESVLAGRNQDAVMGAGHTALYGKKRILTTGGYYAYLKIAEGCDKHCTYCIIPKVRGHYRSVPMEALLAEAETLSAQGVKELILVAQETTVYGQDLYGKKSLPKLLGKLCRINGIEWIRIMYCYPEEIDEELIRTMKEEKKICHYLDLPVQHADDRMLRKMGRRTDENRLREMIGRLRSEIPDICLRTTLITGFPGETAEMFETLVSFVDEMKFERLGVFTYSAEEDTPAAEMPDQIAEEVKESRRDEIMLLQQKIAFEKAEAMVGRTLPAMVEGRLPEEGVIVARTYMDAPGIDGNVFIETDREFYSGTIINVRITGSNEYDLIGELADEPT